MRKFRAFELDRVDARQQLDGRVGDEPGVQEIAQLGGAPALRVLVVVGDELLERRSVARLGGAFGLADQRPNRVFGRARRAACGEGEERGES